MVSMMEAMDIAFPHLGIYLHNVPKTVYAGSFPIAIYGFMLSLGMLAGFTLAAHISKERGLGSDIIWDFAPWAIFLSIIGARTYYVATSWDSYKDDISSIFNLRQGGIAIYGSIIGAFIALYFYTKFKKVSSAAFADTMIIGLPVGQVIGRWGNFFNREAFGQYSDGLFAMRLPIAAVRHSDISQSIAEHIVEGTNYIQVHPTFLYEGAWNVLLIVFLYLYRKHTRFEGELVLMYFAGYGIGRFMIESLRTDQLFIPGTAIPISMFVGAVSAVSAIIAILVLRKKLPKTQYVLVEKE